MNIAQEILNLRTSLGLTQRAFAEKVGIKQPQLARIESGKQLARLDTLEMIAEKCGYSVEIRLVPKIDDELIDRTIDAIIEENEKISLKISSDGKTLELDTETFIFSEEDEEVTDDDENCWVEYPNIAE